METAQTPNKAAHTNTHRLHQQPFCLVTMYPPGVYQLMLQLNLNICHPVLLLLMCV